MDHRRSARGDERKRLRVGVLNRRILNKEHMNDEGNDKNGTFL